MYNLKTKEEMYQDYLNGIEELEYIISTKEIEIKRAEREITYQKQRIEGLREMAEIYAPGKNL